MKNRNLEHKDDWKTPDDLLQNLNKEFNFDFDPCPLYCTEFDGLKIDWGKSNFINPPYSRKLKEAFIHKAYNESLKGIITDGDVRRVFQSTDNIHNIDVVDVRNLLKLKDLDNDYIDYWIDKLKLIKPT